MGSSGVSAAVGHLRGPVASERGLVASPVVALGSQSCQVNVQARVEHHGGGDDEQGALGGVVP